MLSYIYTCTQYSYRDAAREASYIVHARILLHLYTRISSYFTDTFNLLLDSVNVSELRGVFELLSVDPNKSCDLKLIRARLLKEGADEISHFLSRIFHLSLCSVV